MILLVKNLILLQTTFFVYHILKIALIVGKTNSGKTNILMNLIAQNSIYEKIYIYTNNLDEKYKWLKDKFKNDVFVYINEINFDEIDKDICKSSNIR